MQSRLTTRQEGRILTRRFAWTTLTERINTNDAELILRIRIETIYRSIHSFCLTGWCPNIWQHQWHYTIRHSTSYLVPVTIFLWIKRKNIIIRTVLSCIMYHKGEQSYTHTYKPFLQKTVGLLLLHVFHSQRDTVGLYLKNRVSFALLYISCFPA